LKLKLSNKFNLLLLIFFIVGCSESNTQIYIENFNWSFTIPQDFERVSTNMRKESQNKGVKLIKSAYPNKKVNIVAENLFHFKNGKYNTLQAQYSELDSTQSFMEEFNKANEIVVNSFKNKRANSKIITERETLIIDNLEFQVFTLKTDNGSDNNFTFTVYSRMFDNKHLQIITVSNEKNKSEQIRNCIVNSVFK
jgi:hypothetical protein